MKTIAVILGLALTVLFNTGCSSGVSVGHDGHSHGVGASVGGGGVGARVH